MNLLDIFEGREPYQQAIDRLEQRRIEDLEARMDDCARRGDKEGFQKAKAERDSYYKVNEAGIGQDIVDKSEKMARATPQTKAGAVASTVKNAAKWLAGKGGPGKEGPTYEGTETQWSKEGEWKAIPKAKSGQPVDPRGEVTHLSDVARRQAERKAQAQKKNSKEVEEGFQDFNKVEPYAVCLAGKPVKKFDYYEDARRFHDNWKKKLYREGNEEKAEKITLLPLGLDEDDPNGGATIAIGQMAGADADTNPAMEVANPAQQAAIAINMKKAQKKPKTVDEEQLNEFLPALAAVGAAIGRGLATTGIRAGYALQGYGDDDVDEAQTDYSKRRQRERDVDAGKPVTKQRQSKTTDYQKKRAQDKKYMELGEEESLEENLKKWFKEKWVRFGPDGKIRGDCARGSETEGKPKCLPQSKAHSLGKKGRASSAAKKRREDPNPERRGAAKNVATRVKEDELDEACWKGYHKEGNKELFGKTVPNCVKNEAVVEGIPFDQCPQCGGKIVHESELSEKQDACYHKVKSRYKVWPSAYASGALVQCRKKGAANWGNKSESAEQELDEKWSQKYKSSINCSNPKGFSQKAHCAGKKNEGMFSTLEENNEARDAVESAIIRRIMVARTDLLKKFGPAKVIDAASSVADNYSDVEEIGTSDVSAFVHAVENYLMRNH